MSGVQMEDDSPVNELLLSIYATETFCIKMGGKSVAHDRQVNLSCLSFRRPAFSQPHRGDGSLSALHAIQQILVVIAAVFGIVIYRVVTVSTFAAFDWALIRNNSQVATTGTAVCINFCIIMLLNVVSCPSHTPVCSFTVCNCSNIFYSPFNS